MTKEEIVTTVNNFLVEEFEVDGSLITHEANLRETLALDSLDYVDLVVVIESNFGIKIVPNDFATIFTFEDLYNYIIRKIAEKKAS